MSKFSEIAIIYNSKATGHGKQLAEQTKAELEACLDGQTVSIYATKGIGHAEELAYDIAKKSKNPLIISASGDGGYHEVVNGLMHAQNEGAKPNAGLLPAGNANDHHRNLKQGNFVADVCACKTQQIDLLKVTSTIGGKPYSRYAHSYIGIGTTAVMAEEFNKTKVSQLQEFLLTIKIGWSLPPVAIVQGGKQKRYHGLIFSNVASMAKWFKVSNSSRNNDGKFEVSSFRAGTRLGLMLSLFTAIVRGLPNVTSAKSYEFETINATPVQLDGEVQKFDASSKVVVTAERGCWRCII